MPALNRNASGNQVARGSRSNDRARHRQVFAAVARRRVAHYISCAGLRGASGAISPGPYRSLRELSLTGLVGPDTWRPPTLVGNPGSTLQRPQRLRAFAVMAGLVPAIPVFRVAAPKTWMPGMRRAWTSRCRPRFRL